MKRLLVGLAALVAASPVAAGTLPSPPAVKRAFLVELADETDVNDFVNTLQLRTNVHIRRRMDYSLYKGVAIELNDPSKPNEVAAITGVRKMSPIEKLSKRGAVPELHGNEQVSRSPKRSFGGGASGRLASRDLSNSTARSSKAHMIMMQIDQLHSKGLTGKGSKIALIDTGVDYTHPALGGCFGPGCRISFGADFVKGEPTPMKCKGLVSGTANTGVITALPYDNGTIGAAPGAEIGMYRVTCEDVFDNDVVIDAFFRARDQGTTIIASAVYNPGGWSFGPLADAAARLAADGVALVQSTGPGGSFGLFSQWDPAAGPGVITVVTTMKFVSTVLVPKAVYTIDGGDNASFALWPAKTTFEMPDFASEFMELYAASQGLNASDADDCDFLPDDASDLSGKVVIIRHCWRNVKERLKGMADKGGLRVLAYNTPEEEDLEIDHRGDLSKTVAVFRVESDVATTLLEAARSGRKPFVTIFSKEDADGEYRESTSPDAGSVDNSNAWGPSWDLALKPSLLAVGKGVLTLAPKSVVPSGLATNETIVATSLVASIIALVSEARGPLDPATMQSLLVSYSNPQLFYRNNMFLPLLAPVAQQGGGMVRAHDAAFATTIVEVESASLNFNDTEHSVPSREFSLKNLGEGEITYRLSHVSAPTLHVFKPDGNMSQVEDIQLFEAPASLDLGNDTLTVAPKQSATVRVTAIPPTGVEAQRLAIWSGWIAVNGSDGSSLSIPYQGMSGSIREQQVLEPKGASLSYRDEPVSDKADIQLPPQGSAEKSELILHINARLGSPLVRAEVVPMAPDSGAANDTKTIGLVNGFPVQFMASKNGQEITNVIFKDTFTSFRWNGQLDSCSYAPEGPYKFIVRALRIFGDADKEDDWDASETPQFTITFAGSTASKKEPDDQQNTSQEASNSTQASSSLHVSSPTKKPTPSATDTVTTPLPSLPGSQTRSTPLA